ncbi:MAG: hypothetical protein Q4D96_12220 [Propionibacteriaceae bacterium]|nr:hypothetical protein [Propionibacteriaceae bacterium]
MPKRKRHAELKRKQAAAEPKVEAPLYRRSASQEEAQELISRLTSSQRETPVVLISTTDEGVMFTDPEKALALGAEVWVIDRETSFAITDTLRRELTAYDGVSRIFPVGTAWLNDYHESPRYLATTQWHRDNQEKHLLQDLRKILAPPVTMSEADGEAPPTSHRYLHTNAEGVELARSLLDGSRTHPVVVITSARNAEGPYVDPALVAEELDGVAPVYVMDTGAVTWAFSDLLPPGGDVYGGASRVYPPGNEWVRDVYQVPLHFAQSTADGPHTANRIIAAALRWAEPSQHQTMQLRSSAEASGKVLGVVAGQVIIQLDNGDRAHSWPELVAHNVPTERVFVPGQRVTGSFNHANRSFVPARLSPAEALGQVRVDDVVLARVIGIRADSCTVEPYPDFPVSLAPQDVMPSEPGADLRTVVAPNEVLPLQVVACGPEPEDWKLVTVASEEVEASRTISLLPGGPAWLMPTQPELEVEAGEVLDPTPLPAPRPAPPQVVRVPVPVASSELEQLQEENRRLSAQLQAQLQSHNHEIGKLRTQVEQQKQRIAKLNREKGQRRGEDCEAARILEGDAQLFADPAEQLRFEVQMAWLRRFPEQERISSRQLMEWSIGEGFFESWEQVQGIDRRKVVDVIVEVLTDLAPSLASREVHRLRTGLGGDDPVRTRGDQTAWRVSLQVNTPGARRLHYWRGPEGIELASIRHHDDFRA